MGFSRLKNMLPDLRWVWIIIIIFLELDGFGFDGSNLKGKGLVCDGAEIFWMVGFQRGGGARTQERETEYGQRRERKWEVRERRV